MKKLMFAAAVMAVGAAMAVESQIVGYQTTAANKDGIKTAVGVMFAQVGSESYDIQQIVCKDGDQDPENLFRLWWWDPVKGYQYARYQNYEAYADDGEEGGDGTCYDDKFYWCDDEVKAERKKRDEETHGSGGADPGGRGVWCGGDDAADAGADGGDPGAAPCEVPELHGRIRHSP